MEERNLTLEITENNWKNWVEFILEIFPVTKEFKNRVLQKIGRRLDETTR